MLIAAEHVYQNYGRKELIKDGSFYLNDGEKVGLIGVNGAGKSTLLRILAGQEEPDQGEIFRQPGLRIGFLAQNPPYDPSLTVMEEMERQAPDAADYQRRSMLFRLGIETVEQKMQTLSGGQRKRVALAAVLLQENDLLILDEPTNHLDSFMVEWLEGYLKDFTGGLILITHDLGVVAEMCDHCAVMYAGEIVEYGTTEQVFDNPKHPYTRALYKSIPSLDKDVDRLEVIPGLVCDPADLPTHCSFCDRCTEKKEGCGKYDPPIIEVEVGHTAKCFQYSPGWEKGDTNGK